MRIVSLLPSATEIVCALGLSRQLVGVSNDCDWPALVSGKPVMTRPTLDLSHATGRRIHDQVTAEMARGGSLYVLDGDALRRAKPDLIITQALCTVCAVDYGTVSEVARTISPDITVISLEPTSLEGIFNTISTVAAMTETEGRAIALLEKLRARLGRIEHKLGKARAEGHAPMRVVALEWLDPLFSAGHWVPEQVRRAGGWDLLGHEGAPAQRTTWSAIREVQPDLLVLIPCGMGMADTEAEWRRIRKPAFLGEIMAVQRENVFAVDGGSYFSRPGPRVVDGIGLLAEIFDPNVFVDTSPPMSWTPIVA
jgi:iron complex transport system substrate-binding protein